MKLYADRTKLPRGAQPSPLLYPFWGAPEEDIRDPVKGRYDRLVREGHSFLELTSLDDADAVALPAAWEHVDGDPEGVELARACAEVARDARKPLVVIFISDSSDPVPLPGATVLRTSLYRSARKSWEHAVPAFCQDITAGFAEGVLQVRDQTNRPTVSFCGLAPDGSGLGERLKRVGSRFRQSGGNDQGIRRRACEALSRTEGLETSFVFRDRFWGGAVRDGGRLNFDLMRDVRREYVENLLGSDYVVCARGGGNFSYRLYEAMSAGRIPLFVDTDCVLPLEDRIDWRSLCVWVDAADVDTVGERLLEAHASMTPDEFVQRQRSCREAYSTYLAPQGFFRHLEPMLWRG